MKNSLWKILVAILAFVLVATVIVGVLPSSDKEEEATTKKPGVTDTDPGTDEPGVSTLSFPQSDQITTSFMNSLKNAGWVNVNTDPASTPEWEFREGVTSRVAMPADYKLPTGEKLLFHFKKGIEPRLNGRSWELMDFSIDRYEFYSEGFVGPMFNFRCFGSDTCTIQAVKNNLYIYTHSDIQENLQQKNLSNDHLNELIDLLAAPGCFIESSEDEYLNWISDYELSQQEFSGNRIAMRYSVSVPYDIKVSIKDGYDYVLYLFQDVSSSYCTSTVGWTEFTGEFVIPANTAFSIALRPEELSGIYEDDFDYDLNRDDYPYIYAGEWNQIISFELVK